MTGSRRAIILAAGLTSLLLTGGAPAVAASEVVDASASALRAFLAGGHGDAGATGFQQADDATCFTDPSGDTVELESGTPANEPRVDLVEYCGTYTDTTLTLTFEVAQPTNPDTDPAWSEGTLVGWFLDVNGDGEGDFFVDYSLSIIEPEELEVIVTRIDEDGIADGDDEVCRGTPGFDGTVYTAELPSACIGDPDAVGINPGMLFQQDANSPVYADRAPNEGGFAGPLEVAVPPVDMREVERLAGVDRIETAVLASQFQFPNGADVAYLARQDVFADAVAGGTLQGGPILLVPTCGDLPAIVAAELARLGVDQVIALGGSEAICDQLLADAAAAAGVEEGSRIAGPNRYATSVAISMTVFPLMATDVYLARADVFADAVAAGSLTQGPILLVDSCGPITDVVRNEITRLMPTNVYALGGNAAVCDEVLTEAAEAAPLSATGTVGRLAGDTRIGTAIAISQYQFDDDEPAFIYLARQDVLADAVTAGALTGGPILLVPNCGELPAEVTEEIARLDSDGSATIVALGGSVAICDDIVDQAAAVAAGLPA